ncbi:MFS transporter [Streptomyces achromogenes]|uniref:MFS transporter n=1 Tax=Streptomyces achromogenes TaxID=67255 RepID=UPI00369D0CD9
MPGTTRTTAVPLFAAWAVDCVDRRVIDPVLPPIDGAFGLGRAERGVILSSFLVAYMLTRIPAGLVAARFGGARVVCAAVVLWSLFAGLPRFPARPRAVVTDTPKETDSDTSAAAHPA